MNYYPPMYFNVYEYHNNRNDGKIKDSKEYMSIECWHSIENIKNNAFPKFSYIYNKLRKNI